MSIRSFLLAGFLCCFSVCYLWDVLFVVVFGCWSQRVDGGVFTGVYLTRGLLCFVVGWYFVVSVGVLVLVDCVFSCGEFSVSVCVGVVLEVRTVRDVVGVVRGFFVSVRQNCGLYCVVRRAESVLCF